MNSNDYSAENPSLDYHFTANEIRYLAKFFRKNQEILPDALINFAMEIEKVIYNSMTISEAQKFYS